VLENGKIVVNSGSRNRGYHGVSGIVPVFGEKPKITSVEFTTDEIEMTGINGGGEFCCSAQSPIGHVRVFFYFHWFLSKMYV
jgi:hypothetical protein